MHRQARAVSEAGRPRLHCGSRSDGGSRRGRVSEAGRPRLHCGTARRSRWYDLGGFPRPAGLGFIAAIPNGTRPRPSITRVSEAGRPRLHCGLTELEMSSLAKLRRFPRPAGLGFIAADRPARAFYVQGEDVSEAGRPRLHCGMFVTPALRGVASPVSEAGRPRLHCGTPAGIRWYSTSMEFPRPAGLGFIAARWPMRDNERRICPWFPRPAGLGFIAATSSAELDIQQHVGRFPRPAGLGFIAAIV